MTRVVVEVNISYSGGFKETKFSSCELRVTGCGLARGKNRFYKVVNFISFLLSVLICANLCPRKSNLNIKVSCPWSIKLAEEDGLPGS